MRFSFMTPKKQQQRLADNPRHENQDEKDGGRENHDDNSGAGLSGLEQRHSGEKEHRHDKRAGEHAQKKQDRQNLRRDNVLQRYVETG